MDRKKNKEKLDSYWEKPSGKGEIDFYPSTLHVEATSGCNLNCAICLEHGYPKQNVMSLVRPKDFSLDLLPKLEKAWRYAEFIEMHGYGEPFTSSSAWDIISYMENKLPDIDHRKVAMVTNGTIPFNEQNLDRALGKSIHRILISLHASRQQTRTYLQGGNLEKIQDNIRKLAKARKDRGLDKDIALVGAFVGSKSNLPELCDIVEFFMETGFERVNISTLINFKPSEMRDWNVQRGCRTFRYLDELLDTESPEWKREFKRAHEIAEKHGGCLTYSPAMEGKAQHKTIKDCFNPFRMCFITTSGKVFACCENNTKPIGDLNDADFESIWIGDEYRQMRLDIENNRTPRLCKGRLCTFQQKS
jgi:MoaA/NifB/PqqE/SkfB family radical SAM enzyme